MVMDSVVFKNVSISVFKIVSLYMRDPMLCNPLHIDQSGTKANLVAKILATNFGVFFCNIFNVFKYMFNVGVIIM